MARFIKSFLLTCLMLALCFGLPSYAQTTEQWRVTHDSSVGAPPNLYPYKDIGQQIGLDAGGNVYVVETTRPWAYGQPYTPPLEHTIFKYDTYGNKQWARGGFAGHEVKDFHVDPQGNAYILYSVYTDERGGDTVIGKVNSDGTTAWSIYWNNEIADDADWPVAMDVHSSGNVYILIKSDFNPNDMTSFWRSVIQKYDPDGNLLWQVNSPTYDHNPRDIDTDNAGNAYVLSDGMFRKYASADGEFLGYADVEYWWDDDGLPTNPEFWAPVVGVDIEVGSDGGVYIAGTAEQRHWYYVGPGYDDWEEEYHDNFLTAKYDSDLNFIWRDEYGSYEEEDRPWELVFDDDGNILVTGPSADQLATLKYSPAGTRIGTYLYSDTDGWDLEYGPGWDESSGFHIDGTYAYVIELSTLALHKYALSTGVEQWNIPLDDLLTGNDIVVEPSGNFYLTGSVDDVWTHQPVTAWYRHDMVLIKYSQEAVVGNTPAGSNVQVVVGDATITFEEVTASGNTTVTESDTGPDPPEDFHASCIPLAYYNITTAATYSGIIKFCVSYDETVWNESNLHLFLFNYQDGTWEYVTTTVDTEANIICGEVNGEVTSLLKFLLATLAKAWNPEPVDGAMHEDTWVNLSWRPGGCAVSHDVYLGENFDDVDAGAESTFWGNQAATSFFVGFPGFPFPDGLVPGTTYYWRIDEVNADSSIHKGDVWSFEITP